MPRRRRSRSGATSLRVLLCNEPAAAGVGRQVAQLACGLAERGHRVDLAFSPERLDAAFSRFLDEAAERQITLHRIPMRREPSPGDLRAAVAIRRIVSARGPFDVLHAHSSKAGALLRPIVLDQRSLRVYTPHGLYAMDESLGSARRVFYANCEKALARLTHRIIAVSGLERTFMRTLGFASDRLAVIPCGVEAPPLLSRAAARAQLSLAGGEVCVGWVGRFTREKAPELALRVLAEIGDERVRLVMVCDDEPGPELLRLAADLRITQRLLLRKSDDAARVMQAFDALLVTSRYESFGMVLVEAAQAAVPVVSTPVGIAPDLIVRGRNGELFDGADPGDGAAKLVQVLEPSFRAGLSHGQEVADRFGVDKMVDSTVALYGEARERPRR